MLPKNLHEENRHSWNEGVKVRNGHRDNLAPFFRQGGSTLHTEEKELLGDISGLSLVHLQCNCGEDTLSLAQLGAIVTGVDISDEAITYARKLSAYSGISAIFERADIFDWLEQASQGKQRFDVAFSSYGVLFWLSNIKLWAKGIAAILKPGGRLVVIEAHPLLFIFEHDWSLQYSYFSEGKAKTWDDGVDDTIEKLGSYGVGQQDFHNSHQTHEFYWNIGEVVTALLEARLTLTSLTEYPYIKGDWSYERVRVLPDGRQLPPPELPCLPMMYSLTAQKANEP